MSCVNDHGAISDTRAEESLVYYESDNQCFVDLHPRPKLLVCDRAALASTIHKLDLKHVSFVRRTSSEHRV